MEKLKDIYGLIGCGFILIGLIMVFMSLCDTKIELYTEKLKNYKSQESNE